jgi:hypothetical protein
MREMSVEAKATYDVYTGTVTIPMVTHQCWSCGMPYCVPADFDKRNREKNRNWYCPQGHDTIVRETEVTKLKKQLEAETARANKWREDAIEREEQTKAEQRQHAATKGLLTKAKKRAAAGVCPCCNRTFEQLARHMKTQHPNYHEAPDAR